MQKMELICYKNSFVGARKVKISSVYLDFSTKCKIRVKIEEY